MSYRSNLRFFTICLSVAFCQLFIGSVLLAGHVEAALHTTPLDLFAKLFNYNLYAVSAALLISGGLSVVPFLASARLPRWQAVVLVTPQQIMLLFSLASVLLAVFSGTYPDGYIPTGGMYFILIDQCWILLIILRYSTEFFATFFSRESIGR